MFGEFMSDDTKLCELNKSRFSEMTGSWGTSIKDRKRAYLNYFSDAFTPAEKDALEGRAQININLSKKRCDVISGMYSQNNTVPRFLAQEKNDQTYADIYTEIMKYVFTHNMNQYYIPMAGKDQVIGGIGFVRIDLSLDRDPVYGDIHVRWVNPMNTLFDPTAQKPDLSDARDIMTQTFMEKSEMKSLWPDKAAEIDKLEERSPSYDSGNEINYEGKKVEVKERWYKDFITKKYFVINGEFKEFKGDDATFKKLSAKTDESGDSVKSITRSVCVVKVCVTANDTIVLVDAEDPDGVTDFKIVPIFGWYTPTGSDWAKKLHGIPHDIFDLQSEVNFMHSTTVDAVKRLPIAGVISEEGTFVDEREMTNSKGGVTSIHVNKGQMGMWRELQPVQLNSATTELYRIAGDAMDNVSISPDLLGIMQAKSEPGMNVQMRRDQGILSIQDFPQNMSFAKRIIAGIILKMIDTNWSRVKFERILGRPLPPTWEDDKENIEMDIVIDEITDSPSYRIGMMTQLLEMSKTIPIDPSIIIDFSPIPEESKVLAKKPLELQRVLKEKQLELAILQTEMQIKQLTNPPPPPAPAPPQGPPHDAGPPPDQGVPPPDQSGMPPVMPMEQPLPESQMGGMPPEGV
jgi:hypothetical protein